jgi:geranylgeranyl reductase family protein
MQTCDVLVVGGGPAGSSCAWRLRQAGLDVLVLDKATFPREKVCAGWITPAVFDELQIDPAQYARQRVLQPLVAFRTGLIGGPQVLTDYGRPVSYAIRRWEFDDYLLRRSGARLRLGQPVKTIRRTGDGWTVNEESRAPLVVGAGGHFCPVARLLGPNGVAAPTPVVAQQIEFELDDRQRAECPVRPEIPEIYFCDDLKGYGWCIRKGDYLNVGLGREDRRRLPRHVADFCDYLRQQGRIPREMPGRFRGHAYLLHENSPRRLLDDGVLVVGDAAGLAHWRSGEGIHPAIVSGLIAAEVILAAGGDYRRDRLEPYGWELFRRLGKRKAAGASHGLIPFAARRLIGRSLLRSRWFARHVLLNRWFLHARHP